MGKWTWENECSRTLALLIVVLLVLLLILKAAMGDDNPPKFAKGKTLLVYVGEQDGRVILEPYLAPQLVFRTKPTSASKPMAPIVLRDGQALTCDYFTSVRVVADTRLYTLNLRCHGDSGPLYQLDGIAFR